MRLLLTQGRKDDTEFSRILDVSLTLEDEQDIEFREGIEFLIDAINTQARIDRELQEYWEGAK